MPELRSLHLSGLRLWQGVVSMAYKAPEHYHVKVRVYNNEIDFGKGVAELLRRIAATGSLSAAYKSMGMSSSKAWKILRHAEADLGFALVHGSTGGASGGGTVLTDEGRQLLERYTAFDMAVQEAAERAFEKYFK